MSAPRDPGRPLVMRCGAFGDMVLVTSLLRHLAQRFRAPVDLIASGSWTAPLLEAEDCVGTVFLLRSRRMPYALSRGQQRLVRWLRDRGPGPAWYCDLGPGRALLTRGGLGPGYVIDSTAHPWLAGESFAERYTRLGNLTPPSLVGRLPGPITPASRSASLNITPADRAALDRWLAGRGWLGRPWLLVHPGSRHLARRALRRRRLAEKYWPESRWAEVLRGLAARCPQHLILLTGTGAERRMNRAVLRAAGLPAAHDVAGELGVRTLLALLQGARGLVAADTGPAHAAAALGCPTVALFHTADPDLYRPGGSDTPARAVTGELGGSRDILGISPGAVLAAWDQLADARSAAVKPITPTATDS